MRWMYGSDGWMMWVKSEIFSCCFLPKNAHFLAPNQLSRKLRASEPSLPSGRGKKERCNNKPRQPPRTATMKISNLLPPHNLPQSNLPRQSPVVAVKNHRQRSQCKTPTPAKKQPPRAEGILLHRRRMPTTPQPTTT